MTMGELKKLSRRVADIEESQTMAFTERALKLRRSGVDVVILTAGEPDFPTADHVKDAAKEALDQNFTRYTAVQGIPELLRAIAHKFQTVNGLAYTDKQVMVTTGAKQAVTNALLAICEEGDEILIPSPAYVSYPTLVKLVGAAPVPVPSRLVNRFRPEIGSLRKAVTSRTKAIILNSPTNPTGVVYTEAELRSIAEFASDHNLYIISDEIYEEMVFGRRKHISVGTLPGAERRTVTVNGFSKTYAMTGWRIGYMGGPEEIIQAATRIQGQMTSNVNSISQRAGVTALRGPQDGVRIMREEFERRKELVWEVLGPMQDLDLVKPEGAMFYFVGVQKLFGRQGLMRRLASSYDVVEYLLERSRVVLVPGAPFGDDACVRMSFACDMATLREGLQRIKDGIAALC